MIFLQTHLGVMLSIFLNKYPSEVNTMARKLKQPNPSVYGANQPFDTPFPGPISSLRDPTTSDTGFDIGQVWSNRTTNQAWIMTNPGVWALSSPGASDVDTINNLSPVAGNIVIAGGTNLGVVNAGNTVTLNLDAAIDVATSVTSPLFTSGAGVDFTIEAPAGQDVIVQMGDNGGANKTSFTDSDGVEVFSIDSNGSIGTLAGLTVTGAFAQTGGTFDVGQDNAADAINIGTGGERTVTVGSITGASELVLRSGTGDISFTGTVKQIDAELIGQSGVYIPSFVMDSMALASANTGGVATGATGDVNNLMLQSGAIIQEFVVGAGQTILQPIMSANGLIINGDQTVGEGYEYNFPFLQYTIGTSAPFAFELGMYINDMDGAAPYVFGFRKVQANNAAWVDYTDYATMGMIAVSSPTEIVTATELNAAGQVVTNTTDLWGGDGSYHVLRVLVDGSGNVTYTIDGAAPSVVAAFQFDNGDVVIPFIRIEHSASPTDVAIRRMRIGFQA